MNRLTRTVSRTPALLLTTAAMWGMPCPAFAQDLPSAEAGRKSPVLAFALSLFVPGAGQAYNGEWAKGTFVLGSAVAAVGLFAEDGVSCVVDDDGENCTLAAVGLGLASAVLLYSWIDAPLSARAINRRIGLGNATLQVGPRLLVSRGRLQRQQRADLSLVSVRF